MFLRIPFLALLSFLFVLDVAADAKSAIYVGYDVSIKKATRGKRSGDFGHYFYAIPDHDVVSVKIRLKRGKKAGIDSWPDAEQWEGSGIWSVMADTDDFVLEDLAGNVYRPIDGNPSPDADQRQYRSHALLVLKENGKQSRLYPSWLSFDIPKHIADNELSLRVANAHLALGQVENINRKCDTAALKSSRCDYQLPPDKPSAMVTFKSVTKDVFDVPHEVDYSIFPWSCSSSDSEDYGFILGIARNDIAPMNYQARLQAGEPVIIAGRFTAPGSSYSTDDDRHCTVMLELTFVPDTEYRILSSINRNTCELRVFEEYSGFDSWNEKTPRVSHQVPKTFWGKPDCESIRSSETPDS